MKVSLVKPVAYLSFSYSSSCIAFGETESESGSVALTVSNGAVTVTVPGGGSGTVNQQGGASFGAGGVYGVTYSFTGNFSVSDSHASGGGYWTATASEVSCTGSWSVAR